MTLISIAGSVSASEITGTLSMPLSQVGGTVTGGSGSFVSGSISSNVGGNILVGNVTGGGGGGGGGSSSRGGGGGGGGGNGGFTITSNQGSVATNNSTATVVSNTATPSNTVNLDTNDFFIRRIGDSSDLAVANNPLILGDLEAIAPASEIPQTAALSVGLLNNPMLSIWLWMLLIVLIFLAVAYNNYQNRKIIQEK
jgi:hypothetical protein